MVRELVSNLKIMLKPIENNLTKRGLSSRLIITDLRGERFDSNSLIFNLTINNTKANDVYGFQARVSLITTSKILLASILP